MRSAALILALLAVLAGGCQRQQPQPSGQLDPDDYGELPGLKATPNAKLRDELARIAEEDGTPELLSKTTIAEGDNVAAGLAGLFPDHKVQSILEESQRLFPPGEFELDPTQLRKAIELRKKYDAQRLKARDALGRPQCDFGIRFKAGFLAELKFIDVVRICAHLEAFRAAEALSDGELAEAVESLRLMFRLASCLGAEKHVDARLAAAFIRGEAFRVLQTVVQDGHARRKHLQQLYEAVRRQLTAWPHDADAWIGERALGLHAYEMARDGTLISLLTPEEIERFGKEGILEELTAAGVQSINRDELYYLEAMRKIIESCSQPYYLRAALFDSIGNDLQQRQNTADFPLVAARLLLPDIRKAQAMQAQDRANWEAWAVALALATRGEMPPYKLNPLTGEKYRQFNYDDRIVVANFGSGKDGDDPSITVPNLGGGE